MEEIWKDIPGFEGLYQASNMGRIRSLDREVRHNYGGTAVKKGKILTPHTIPYNNGIDRWEAHFSVNGEAHHYVWARCIWTAFNGPIPDGMQVNHIDEDPTNNKLENLNLMTPKENTNWGTGIERRAKSTSDKMKGKHLYEKNPNSKAVVEYNADGVPVCFWFTLKAAAEHHNRHYSTIWSVIVGKTKSLRDGTRFEYYERETV